MRPKRFSRGTAAGMTKLALMAMLGLLGTAAQSVIIAPVLVELSPARRVASISVSNPGASPVTFQTQVLTWRQEDGLDKYEETNELIIVPPIAEINAGGTQLFRVTTRLPPNPQETAFRLILDDVTDSPPASGEGDGMKVIVRVGHNLPVFFAAAGKPLARPKVAPCATPPKTPGGCIRIVNEGDRYVVVKSLTLAKGDWRKEMKVSTRVLAGAWRQWEFDLKGAPVGSLQVTADTSEGPVAIELPAQ